MEGERILRCVKSPNVDTNDLFKSVQAYLGPVLCGGGRDTKDGKYGKFSLKLLKECIERSQQHEEGGGGENRASSPPPLLDLATLAIDCLKKLSSPAPSRGDRLLFEKLLFNFARECFSAGQYDKGTSASLLAFERLDSSSSSSSATLQTDVVGFLKQLFNLLWSEALKAEETASSPDPDLLLNMKRVALSAALRAGLQLDFVLPRALKADTKYTKSTAGAPSPSPLHHRQAFHSLLVSCLSVSQSSEQDGLPCKTLGLYVEELLRFSAALGASRCAKDAERVAKEASTLLQSHGSGRRGGCSPESIHACRSARAIMHATELVTSLRHLPLASSSTSDTHPAKSLEELRRAVEQVLSSLSDKTTDLDAIGRLCDSIDLLVSALESQRLQAGGWSKVKCLPLSRKSIDHLRALFGSYAQLKHRLLAEMVRQAKRRGGGDNGCGSMEGAEAALTCKHLYLLNVLQEMLVDLLASSKERCVEGDEKGEEEEEGEEGEEEEDIELPRGSSSHSPVDTKTGLIALCLPLLEESREILRVCAPPGVPEEEHRWLGGSAYNLGVTLHRCGARAEAVRVLGLACEEMGAWCSGKEGRMLEVSLLEKQCLLASYQRELALHTKAMDTLMLATSTAASTGLLEDPQRRCGLVQPVGGAQNGCLGFWSTKERECDGGVVRVVEELMEVYRCEGRVLDRTRMLTEQAILNRKKGDRHAIEFFTDIIGILESLKKSEKSNSYVLANQLATAHFWKAVCIYDQLMERCGKIASPPPPSPDEITAVEGEEQLCLAPEEGKVLLSTDSMMACLEVAVEHWHTMSRTVVQNHKTGDFSHDWTTFELMTVSSYMCVVQHRPLVAIKVLAALAQTYEAVPSPSLQAHYHNALALKARLLSGCGVPAEVAECYLEPPSSLKAPPSSSSPVSSGGRARRALVTATLHAKLSLAAIKLSNDELDACRSLLTEVLSHPHLSSCYPSSYVLQARAKLLAASLLRHRPPSPLLTPEQVLDHLESTPSSLLLPHFALTPLELAMDALRLLQGVVGGDALKKGEEAQKRASVEVRGWELCEGLLEALKMAAEMHWLCGMVREAYYYAREGLKLARSKALRYWTITFYLILAKVLVVKGNLPTARSFLCQAGQLFDPSLSPHSPSEAFHKVVQSSPAHLQQCVDLLTAVLHLAEEEGEEEVGGASLPPPLVTPQDLLHLISTCSPALDQRLLQLCGGRVSPKLPWFSTTPSCMGVELEVSLLQARAFSRAGDPGKCLGVCRQAFGQLKRQGQRTDPRCWQLGAHLYVVAGACVVAAKETKTKVKLTKQDDAREYFLMAFQLCFPFSSALLLRETCLWLSSCMAEASPLLAGHFLSLGMQLTLTHQAVYSIGQKLRKRNTTDTADAIATLQRDGAVDATPAMKARQSFPPLGTMPPVAYTRLALDSLPLSWILCTLAVDPGERYLLVMRAGRERDPLLVRIALPEQNIPEAHQQCLMSSKDSLAIRDKKKWWAVRRELDTSLETLCGDLEDCWLGHWKCLLVGKAPGDRTSVVDRVYEQLRQGVGRKWVELLVETWGCLSQEEVCQLLGEVADSSLTAAQKKQAYSAMEDLLSPDATPSHQPTVLVASHTLQCLPWESIPVLRERAVCRMPSLAFVVAHRHMLGHDGCGLVNPLNTFYVLNPEKNLPKTEKCFEWFTKEPGWEGLVGEEPNDSLLKTALEQHQLYIYCGHGSGGKYLSADQLHLVHCKAASVLMGCSSGRLAVHGSADPSGVVLQYLISGCPAIVANLWDVTDEDIDRYCECLLDNWLSGSNEPLLKHTSSARSVCKLKYLIGASPVVYGIPVCTSK
eukprot:Em0007g331a